MTLDVHAMNGHRGAAHLMFGFDAKYRDGRRHLTGADRPKMAYLNHARAVEAVREIIVRRGYRLDCYACPDCAGWHLGRNRFLHLDEVAQLELGPRVVRHLTWEHFNPSKRFTELQRTLERFARAGSGVPPQ